MRSLGLVILITASSAAQTADPAYASLDQAYERLRARDYDAAIAGFRRAAEVAPRRPDIRKNLAYVLLKVGETESAREQFAVAMELDPADHHVALEFAFLAFETSRQREARLVFDRIRASPNAAARATAEQAFQNVDRPLAEGIARWQQALDRDPKNFSAHEEIARLAEQRNDWALAARHYEAAWHIKPGERRLLLDLGRAWKETGRAEESIAALLAASRGAEPRSAEAARSLLPAGRYPFVYEFRAAVALDPPNVELRRELAYLLLEMGEKPQAEAEFQQITKDAPDDLLSAAQNAFLLLQRGDKAAAQPILDRVLARAGEADEELADRVRAVLRLPKALRRRDEEPRRDAAVEARELAEKSYKAGYMKDALKYLTIVHESDPLDYNVMLKLGFAHNMLKDDRKAMDWFKLARYSPDPSIAGEAQRAYRALEPQYQRFRTTTWMLPFYSSRWNNAFSYGQVKTEIKVAGLLRPYVSMRFVGDARGSVRAPYPQYLSETAFILGAGVATPVYRGLMAWGEAGAAISYLRREDQSSRALPDYRGGVSFSRARGHLLGAEKPGMFWENHEDAVFVSRFANSLLLYTQNKIGYTRGNVQAYWNVNLTGDVKRQYWANFVETGPGVRFRWASLPPALSISIDVVRGVYTVNTDNPRRPNFFDIRAGLWYAFTR